ncbi:hypothetical protein GGF46_005516 [Coemansia sp. RSA 552]|nr:hypothetical protein GGF46_005516 [Coemansia sp. RSA 552]
MVGRAVRYLDALEVFSRGDLAQVRKLVGPWMAAYNAAQAGGETAGEDPLIAGSTPLHLAVQCPRKDVILAILEDGQVPMDGRDGQGMTALHLAAKASRRDVVKLLLRHGADDLATDSAGQDPLAYATEPGVAAVLQDHRSEMAHRATTQLFAAARVGDREEVSRILAAEPRRINLEARDADGGGTILHVAVQQGLVDLARWAITEGVDAFATDAQDATADSYAKKEEGPDNAQMRELLQQAPMGSRVALERAPRFSGSLQKWTNYAGGWKARWFELEEGVLSYYKNKADVDGSCRGAINLRVAKIILGKDKVQFEVHGKGSIKYRLKAQDQRLAKQWVHLLNLSKQWALERQRHNDSGSGASQAAPDGDAQTSTTQDSASQMTRPRTSSLLRPKGPEAASVKAAPHALAHTRGRSVSSLGHEANVSAASSPPPPPLARLSPGGTGNLSVSDRMDSPTGSIISNESDDDDELYIARDTFATALSELRSQLFIQERLLDGLPKGPESEGSRMSAEDLATYRTIAAQTIGQSRKLIERLDRGYRETTAAWKARMHREQERIDMLADSLRNAVVSSQTLFESMRQQESRPQGQQEGQTSEKHGQSSEPMPTALAAASSYMSDYGINVGIPDPAGEGEDEFADATDEFFDAVTSVVSITPSRAPSSAASVRRRSTTTAEAPEAEAEKRQGPEQEAAEKEDEAEKSAQTTSDLTALHGYDEHGAIRAELPEIAHGGPPLNLWSIIKGAIGKDLSKVSVPVFFNEPTSFLQRFTEDMEYSDLLDIATLLPRSADRTLFVAGFAMSNYASTFGRIAKPFNPLLGETYEYVRRDKKYRALSEQVCHHPPISACMVEGQNYTYHADTNIKSRFNSGSLTVVPTGVCHVELRLPLEFLSREEETQAGAAQQAAQINEEEGYFTEHYTWNKLTTNVNGIMIANFWIEHVGDLDVRNHRTGDFTRITFMQSGWTGRNKFKVTGEALDRRGAKVYEIGGDWTSKLVARPVGASATGGGSGEAEIERPSTMDSVSATDAVKYAAKNSIEVPRRPFVLWKINERQTKNNTYHLTTYAMSLNDKPAELEPYLCPTDSRFRPDQRAMETGEYELADQEKSRLENKQRATRRRREQGELEQWKPRWFEKAKDEDSGEEYWRFTSQYWSAREQVAQKMGDDPSGPPKVDAWPDVEDIF